MKANEVASRILKLGGRKLRQNGSHARFICPCGKHHTTVSFHSADILLGTLRGIERDLPCLGRKWLR